MKPLSKTLTELGIAFTFPIEITDSNGNQTYCEDSNGYWDKYERDANGNQTYCEDSNGYWCRYERDANDLKTYYEDSDDFWYRYERDADGNETYYENSNGVKRGTPRSAKSAKTREGKVVEVDGIKYKLTAL